MARPASNSGGVKAESIPLMGREGADWGGERKRRTGGDGDGTSFALNPISPCIPRHPNHLKP
jgi:hypothetical protein